MGIGTTTPTHKLDVRGRVKIDSTLVVKDSVVLEKDVRINQKLVVDQKVVMKEDAVVRQDLRVQGKSRFDSTAVFNDKIRFTNIVDVPNFNNREILLINQNGLIQKSGVEAFIDMVYSKDCSLSGNNSGVVLNPTWKNGPNKIFVNCPDVFVGIATNNPRVSLDVRGTAYANKLALGTINPQNAVGLLHIKNNNSSNTDPIVLIEKPNQKLLQLNNDGLLFTREVKVSLENWPDYVFEKDYPLMPLQEVSTFIQENGHLPNVPKAETIENEGLSLGEMNKILMEKIEELTLHLIQQEKRIQELEKNAK